METIPTHPLLSKLDTIRLRARKGVDLVITTASLLDKADDGRYLMIWKRLTIRRHLTSMKLDLRVMEKLDPRWLESRSQIPHRFVQRERDACKEKDLARERESICG
ncbi:hypothetical protein L484_025641 [Morus notabilis]|uniref:Uncharacterized protein n=1 Tax=Morus notabilis TaxID=981085 RepID=W9RH02_9ROSA|nr:hypothetical protein L484_025641 [Morus notabilis]